MESYNYNITRFQNSCHISSKTLFQIRSAPRIEIIKYELDIKLNILYRKNWL